MGRDTIQIEDAVSTISEEYLLEFTSEYGIPESLHPELPGPEEPIVEFPEGKVGVYTKFFEFANYRIPISQFLFDILGYYQIHLSQLSVIGAAKVSHFEINCRVLNIILTLNLFRVFYVPSYNSGWMSFRKRPRKNTPQCYTKPLGSLKNWNNRFFWVDERIFSTVVEWRTNAPKDKMLSADSYSAADLELLSEGRRNPTFLYDDDRDMDLFKLISAPNPAKVKTGTRPRAAHEVPLLTVTTSRVIDMEDTAVASGGTKDQVEDGLSHEIPPVETATTTEVVQEPGLEKEVAAIGPPVNKRRRKRDNDEGEANAPPKSGLHLRHTCYTRNSYECEKRERAKTVDLCESQPHPERDIAQSSRKTAPEIPTENVATTEVQDLFSMESSRSSRKTTPEIPTMNVTAEVHGLHNRTKNLETLLEAEVDMKKAAEAKNAGLAKELESLCVQFSDLQVSNNQLSQQVSNLQAQVTGEEKIKAAFEEFKKYEDDRVEQRCAEMDALLDKLSVDFDEELYPHMLTAIAGRRWVLGHDLRLAVMKCVESPKLRQVFADVVSARLVKGMNEGLKHGIEHRKDDRDLAVVEAYYPEADSKYVKALQDLKDLKYPLVDQLEKLKDAPIELIMASLHLENPWAFKEEMLLEDAIADNISWAEKMKKCRVVYRTHGIGSAHHARSDGIPVSVPTISPRGLAILLADAATQTEVADEEDEPHPRLQRSISLPHFYNLE
ncbi:hypothetical protein Tco_0528030 [Tanacetum coccineum]